MNNNYQLLRLGYCIVIEKWLQIVNSDTFHVSGSALAATTSTTYKPITS